MACFLWPLFRPTFFLRADLAAFAGFRLIVATVLLLARLVFFAGRLLRMASGVRPWAKSRIGIGPILKHERDFCRRAGGCFQKEAHRRTAARLFIRYQDGLR